jgi:hypothetical protein
MRDFKPPQVAVACKVGTQPALVVFDRRCRFAIGRVVRMRFYGHGEKWFHATLRNINPIRVDR